MPNFLFFALSQLIVLAVIAITLPRPAVLAGAAVALSLYLGSFHAWLFSQVRPESMAWLGYLFSLPGAVVAGLLIVMWVRGRRTMSGRTAMLGAAAATLAGLAIAQTAICNTVMYCSL